MVIDAKLKGKHLFLQIVILILVVAIPMHFYISSELENIKYRDNVALNNYAKKVANKVYKFSNSKDYEFYFPRSNLFNSAIYRADDTPIFSLLKQSIKSDFNGMITIKDIRYLKFNLKDNVFNGDYLIVSMPTHYSVLVVNVIVILMVVSLLIFFIMLSFMHQSIKPYQELNIALENFIKDAMHEMKTPIGVILLNLDALSQTYNQNKMIQRAKSALKNMVVVYEDLEFFVRNQKVSHKKERINLSKFIAQRVEFFKDLLDARGIKVVKDIKDEVIIKFSPLELSRVIDNTLSNAIKYSKENSTITVTLKSANESAILCIKDEGRGIEDKSRVFERYYRGDKISGGFGIGLNIVKKICDRNKVKIEINSVVGKGSTFCYNFIKKDR